MKQNQLPKIVRSANQHRGDSMARHSSRCDDTCTERKIVESSRLILHFDINETILVGDDAGGDSWEDCLNKILAKCSFVQIPDNSCTSTSLTISNTQTIVPTHWWDGSPIPYQMESTLGICNSPPSSTSSPGLPPPLFTGWDWPEHTCPYYRTFFKKYARRFTEQGHHGAIYRPVYEEMQQRLIIPGDIHSKLDSNRVFHHILPAFFNTLYMLRHQKREYTLVLRTFGSDLEYVADALSRFAHGQHPMYPDFRDPNLLLTKDTMFRGRWKACINNDGLDHELKVGDSTTTALDAVYELHSWQNDSDESNTDDTTLVARGDHEVLSILKSRTVVGIQDDYEWWSTHKNKPWAGKPVWTRHAHGPLGEELPMCHHLFFDDNIHNDATDSIVAVRCAWISDDGTLNYRSLSGEEVQRQHGRCIIRVPTIEPIMNVNWFIEQIAATEQRIELSNG